MLTIKAKPGAPIYLGRLGENETRQVVFDITKWVELYGEGTVQLIAQRENDTEPYPCVIETDGSCVFWTITEVDVEQPGITGKCELSYIIGERVAKSETWRTVVSASMGTPSETAPEPQKAWVDQVLQAGTDTQTAADRAEAAAAHQPIPNAETGTWWVWNGETYEDTGEKYQGEGGVKTVNGTEPDENGNVEVTAGVQSDWDQNDETAQDYVKNRPFYSYTTKFEMINGTYTSELNTAFGVFVFNIAYENGNFDTDADNGMNYPNNINITLDGAEYNGLSLVVVSPLGRCAGNLSYLNVMLGTSYENTGEPFVCNVNMGALLIVTDPTQSTTQAIAMSVDKTSIKRMSSNFIQGLIGQIGDVDTAEVFNSYLDGTAVNVASGNYSHAEGCSTIASGVYQHVQGRYNIEDAEHKYAHIVGNGGASGGNGLRSNAHTIDWNGLGWFAGGLKVGGTGQDDAEAKDVVAVAPTAAEIGQAIVVKAIDDNGVPTEWEVADLGPKLLGEITLTSENCTMYNNDSIYGLSYNDDLAQSVQECLTKSSALKATPMIEVDVADLHALFNCNYFSASAALGASEGLQFIVFFGDSIDRITIQSDKLVSPQYIVNAVTGGYPLTIKIYAS